MSEFIFKSPNGRVYFNVDQMHGCCGIAVISHPDFLINIGSKRAQYELIENYISGLEYDKCYESELEIQKINKKIKLAKSKINTLYQDFNTFILNTRWDESPSACSCDIEVYPSDLKRSRVIMTDYSGGGVYDFCTKMKWSKSKSFRNHRTNNDLYIFQLKRR